MSFLYTFVYTFLACTYSVSIEFLFWKSFASTPQILIHRFHPIRDTAFLRNTFFQSFFRRRQTTSLFVFTVFFRNHYPNLPFGGLLFIPEAIVVARVLLYVPHHRIRLPVVTSYGVTWHIICRRLRWTTIPGPYLHSVGISIPKFHSSSHRINTSVNYSPYVNSDCFKQQWKLQHLLIKNLPPTLMLQPTL